MKNLVFIGLVLLLAACVPIKKYRDLEANYNKCLEEQSIYKSKAIDYENQSLTTRSLASRSEWALSTRAVSEVGSESDASSSSAEDEVSDEEGQSVGRSIRYPGQRQRLYDEEDPLDSHPDPLVLSARREDGGAGLNESSMQYNDASSQDHFADSGLMQDDLSVDSFVPLRVVDLIKRFSPPSAPSHRQLSADPKENNVF